MQNTAQTQANVNNFSNVVLNDNMLASVNSNNAVITVGLNDRVQVAPVSQADTVSKTVYGYEGIFQRIDQLVSEREVWEHGAFRTSNAQLYALLDKCYSFYFEMLGTSPASCGLRSGVAEYIVKRGYSFTKSTHTLTKIVKCVFGVDRRRVSTYSLVLREALAQKIKVNAVADFIASKGGVEEIRRSGSKTAITPQQKAELGKQAVSSNSLAVISSDKIAESIDLANVDSDFVAIVTQQADGSLIVRKLVYSQSVLNAALSCAYSASKSKNKQETKNAVAANDTTKQNDLILKAANI